MKNKQKTYKQKTYNVIWTEKLSIQIQANSEQEAVEKVHDCEYDNNQISTEIDSTPEAYEIKQN